MNPKFLRCFGSISSLFRHQLAFLSGVLLCLSPITLPAQSVTFNGTENTLPTEGLLGPSGIAVDSAGDVFIVGTEGGGIVELPRIPTGFGPQESLPFIGLIFPESVAVDGAGDLFVADGVEQIVVELPWMGASYGPQITLATSGLGPVPRVGVDSKGDVFIADPDNDRVVELPQTETGFGPQTILPTSGLYLPTGVAVDSAGDVFISDLGNDRIVELPRTATGYDPQITLPVNGLNAPEAVAVNGMGDVFIVNAESEFVELPSTGTGYGPQFSPLAVTATGVAVDNTGDVFVDDGDGFRVKNVLEVQTSSVNFGGANICPPGTSTPAPCSKALTLNYKVNADGRLSTPKVLTGGLANLDFTLASGSTCTGKVTAGTTCAVNVTFAPLAAGFRNGKVQITDGSGKALVTTQISGFGSEAITGPPVAQVSSAYLPFGTIALGKIETLSLAVANIGGGTLTVAPSISGSSDYAIAANTCGGGVTSGTSCTLVVGFSPKTIANHYGLLTVQTNGGNPTVGLEGGADGLSVFGGVSYWRLKFGSVASGSTEVLPLTVTNVGLPGTVTVGTAITVGATTRPTTTYTVLTTSANTCLAGISAGQSCTLPIEFAPTLSGIHDDLLTLTPSVGAGPSTVWLDGTTP